MLGQTTPSIDHRDQAIDEALAELDKAQEKRTWFLTADLPGGLPGTARAIRDWLDDAIGGLQRYEREAVEARLTAQPDKFPNVNHNLLTREVFSQAFLEDRARTQALIERARQLPLD